MSTNAAQNASGNVSRNAVENASFPRSLPWFHHPGEATAANPRAGVRRQVSC